MNGVDEVSWKSVTLPKKQMVVFTYEMLKRYSPVKSKAGRVDFLKQFKEKGYVVGLLYEPKNLKKCTQLRDEAGLDCFEQSPVSQRYAFNYIDMVAAQGIEKTNVHYVEKDETALSVINSFGLKTVQNPKSLLSENAKEATIAKQTLVPAQEVSRKLYVA